MRRNLGAGWDGELFCNSTIATFPWVKTAPAKIKNWVGEAIWSSGSSAGIRLRIQGCMSTLSTDVQTIILFKSSAKGQAVSTGTGTKAYKYIRAKSTAGAVAITATKTVRVAWMSATT